MKKVAAALVALLILALILHRACDVRLRTGPRQRRAAILSIRAYDQLIF